MLKKILFLTLTSFFLACSFTKDSHKKLKWKKLNQEVKFIKVSGLEIKTPPKAYWEYSVQKNKDKIIKFNLRDIYNKDLYSAFGHIRALGLAENINNSLELKEFADLFLKEKTSSAKGAFKIALGACVYNCAKYKFTGETKGFKKEKVNIYGYFFQHPNKTVFEVMLSEKFINGVDSKFSSKELDDYFLSFRFK